MLKAGGVLTTFCSALVLVGCASDPASVCPDYDQPNPVAVHVPDAHVDGTPVAAVALCTGTDCAPSSRDATTERDDGAWIVELDGTPDGPARVALFDAVGGRLHEETVDLTWTDVRFGSALQCRSGGRSSVWIDG
ncbi:hypothetical protein [Curtobacterium sp. ER1/6]|uniref:hypothetical protein n=1 Tax=Curtobacterium sp. ER1/6 TaxID=1891920 RepID=UPI00084F9AFE|nr:hypothetical protein [Curtobacterium sp. ER1/6]OEI69964.1 hypothetical protein Cus16_0582 [Curtobacterium sp. ER1/6]